MKILYLTTRLPAPPLVKGDTLRDFYIIRELAARGHQVTLVSFSKHAEMKHADLKLLASYCRDVHIIPFNIGKQALHLSKGLFSQKPFQVLLYTSRQFQSKVDALLAQETFDVAYVHFTRLADVLKEHPIPKIVDLQDSFEKLLKERYTREKNILMKMLVLTEAQRMKVYEKHISEHFSYATVVSERDICLDHQNMFVVPNGRQDLMPISRKGQPANSLLFVGNMSYFPNEDAALFLIKEVMPRLTRHIPNIELHIVGSNPSKKLLQCTSEKIHVTGFVQDLYPYFSKARIAVAPLRYGTGMQNKVLDAMSVGIPQIVSAKAASGLQHLGGDEFLITECEAQDVVEKVLSLWDNTELQERLVQRGHEYVLRNYSWSKSVEILENLFKMSIEKASPLELAV